MSKKTKKKKAQACAARRPTTASAQHGPWLSHRGRPATAARGEATTSTCCTASRSPTPTAGSRTATSAEVAAWVAAQNERTRRGARRPARPGAAWHERLVRADGPADGAVGGRFAATSCSSLERPAGAEQFVAGRSARPIDRRAAPRVAARPGRASPPTRAVAIDWFEPSPDGSLVAYGMSARAAPRTSVAARHRRRPAEQCSPTRSPTPGPHRSRGCPTAPASATPATRPATSTTGTSTSTARRRSGRRRRSVFDDFPTPSRGPT